MKLRPYIAILLCLALTPLFLEGETLEVKQGRSAIVKEAPSGNAAQFPDRLAAGTRVEKLGEFPRYYSIRLPDGRVGWSYKGNFRVVETADGATGSGLSITKESLLARTDVLKIIVLDVEVGDATLIISPSEDGNRDVILIDTGENDSDRIVEQLVKNGFSPSDKPITRFIITHYDGDHLGAAAEIIPLSQVIYDHGDNIKNSYKNWYTALVIQPNVDRREMTLAYHETFAGGVELECVAVNKATDFDPNEDPSPPDKDNPNSIALLVSFDGFDYFTGGDLTLAPEKSLATGIRNVDVYHVNHHGSSTTSSDLDFVKKLDPEVSIVSNGTRHGHPTHTVAQRLISELNSIFLQTNVNPDPRAHNPPAKYVGDDTFHEDSELENAEGATGTITIVVDPETDKYYVVMAGLPLSEGTFEIEK